MAQGFLRTDGTYMARTADEVLRGELKHLPLSEEGVYVGHRPYWLNLDVEGNPFDDRCEGFSTNDNTDGDTRADIQYATWVVRSSATRLGCDQDASLFCVGTNGVYDLDAPGITWSSYVFFVTQDTWRPTATGRSSADQLCQSEASAADLPGNYGAYLSIEDEHAGERINAAQSYVRSDGTPLMDTIHLVEGTVPPQPTTPINIYADGTMEREDLYVWTGNTTSLHCSSFTSTSGNRQRGRFNRPVDWIEYNYGTSTASGVGRIRGLQAMSAGREHVVKR